MWFKFSPLLPESTGFGRLYFPKRSQHFPFHMLFCTVTAPLPSQEVEFNSSLKSTTAWVNDWLVTNRMWQKWDWDFRAQLSRSLSALYVSGAPSLQKLPSCESPSSVERTYVSSPLVNCPRGARPSSHPRLGITWVRESSWKWILHPTCFNSPWSSHTQPF